MDCGAPGVAGQLAEGGLAGVTWPQEFGGQGLGPMEPQVIVNQELGRAGVPGSSTSSAWACSARA